MTNLAAAYGVTIQPAPETAAAWRATSVRRLSGSENVGSRNVFVKVFKANGDRDRNQNLRIGWTWEGKRPDEQAPPAKLDKGDRNERGHGDVPINKFQKITVWVEGDGIASDRVTDMHTGFVSDGPGNSWGHFSYEVIFQRSEGVVVVPPVVVDPPVKPDGVTKAEFWSAINAIQKQLDDMKALMTQWIGD
jgi:hypothetical protein